MATVQKAKVGWKCSCGAESTVTEDILLIGHEANRLLDESGSRERAREHNQKAGLGHNARPIILETEDVDVGTPVTQDREVLDVVGVPVEFEWDNEERFGRVKVRSLDGEDYDAFIPNKTVANWVVFQWCRPEPDAVPFSIPQTAYHRPGYLVKKAAGDPRLFRLAPAGSDNPYSGVTYEVFGVVTDRWHPVEAQDIAKVARETFPEDVQVRVTKKATGRHGGALKVILGEGEFLGYSLAIDAGMKNGKHSALINGHSEVFYCSNQITVDVSPIVKDIITSTRMRRRHSENAMEDIRDQMVAMAGQMERMEKYLLASKEISMDSELMNAILNFYVGKRRISDRTADVIRYFMRDRNIQDPGHEGVYDTLYGLAMVVTWVGTHKDLAQMRYEGETDHTIGNFAESTVPGTLRALGGELILVTQAWDDFLDMVLLFREEDEVEELQIVRA